MQQVAVNSARAGLRRQAPFRVSGSGVASMVSGYVETCDIKKKKKKRALDWRLAVKVFLCACVEKRIKFACAAAPPSTRHSPFFSMEQESQPSPVYAYSFLLELLNSGTGLWACVLFVLAFCADICHCLLL